MRGTNASTFLDSIAFNTHIGPGLNYSYNAPFFATFLSGLGIHHLRDSGLQASGLNSNNQQNIVARAYDVYGSMGVKIDPIAGAGETGADFLYHMGFVNATQDIEAVEAVNENASQTVQLASLNALVTGVIPTYPSLPVFGPSLGAHATFAGYPNMAALGANYGNIHDYMNGNSPEAYGWAGNSFFGPLGSSYYCNQAGWSVAEQRCDANLGVPISPVVSTESGFCTTPTTYACMDEITQGTYLIRSMLWHWMNGISRAYVYDLANDAASLNPVDPQYADAFWGLFTYGGTPKVSGYVFNGFAAALSDKPHSDPCNLPISSISNLSNTPQYFNTIAQPTTIMAAGFCKANGEFDLVLWAPYVSWNLSSGAYGAQSSAISPVSVSVALSTGFTPTRSTLWTYDTSGTYTFATPSPSGGVYSLGVVDKPSILAINGPVPTPLPSIPSPLPTLSPDP